MSEVVIVDKRTLKHTTSSSSLDMVIELYAIHSLWRKFTDDDWKWLDSKLKVFESELSDFFASKEKEQ